MSSLAVRFFVLSTLITAFCIACDEEETEVTGDPSPSVTSSADPTLGPQLLTPETIIESGYTSVIAADNFSADPNDTGPTGYFRCETDAAVRMQYGVVTAVNVAPESFSATDSEPIYRPDGTQMDTTDNTVVGVPVYRDEAGKLILGWRHCEDAYPSATPQ
jgi:hypothetical protein